MATTSAAKPVSASTIKADPSSDVYRSEAHPLDAIFAPHSVAVIGATDRAGSVGRAVLWSRNSSPFGGTVYPVSEKRSSVLGIKAYKSVADLPEAVDLGGGRDAPGRNGTRHHPRMRRSRSARQRSSSRRGSRNTASRGRNSERQILESIQGTGMRVVGPNCLGVMNPIIGLNATFASSGIARAGNVGFISQSGALCTAILDWSPARDGGFQRVCVGSARCSTSAGVT